MRAGVLVAVVLFPVAVEEGPVTFTSGLVLNTSLFFPSRSP